VRVVFIRRSCSTILGHRYTGLLISETLAAEQFYKQCSDIQSGHWVFMVRSIRINLGFANSENYVSLLWRRDEEP